MTERTLEQLTAAHDNLRGLVDNAFTQFCRVVQAGESDTVAGTLTLQNYEELYARWDRTCNEIAERFGLETLNSIQIGD